MNKLKTAISAVFFVDIISYLMVAESPPVVLKLVPGNRLVRGYSIREWDFGVFFCEPSLEKYNSLGHLITIDDVLMVPKESPYQNDKDLVKATLVKPRFRLSMPLPIEKREGIQIVSADTVLDSLRMVSARRVDAALISKQAIAWLARKHPEKISELRQLAVTGSRREICLFAAKNIAPERQQRLQQRLNTGEMRDHLATLQTLYFGEQITTP